MDESDKLYKENKNLENRPQKEKQFTYTSHIMKES